MLSRLASGLVFCCLVSACIFLPWLLCSCVLLCGMLGLPWAFFGPLPGLSWDPFWASEGPFWDSWRPLGLQSPPGPLPGCSWAAPWPVLGDPGRTLGSLLVALGPLLARPWAAPGHSGAVLAASWASFGASWAALGRRKRFSRNLVKTVVFAWFLRGFGPSGPLLAALGWLLGRPKWSWVALGPS